jgi:hypothetical protein
MITASAIGWMRPERSPGNYDITAAALLAAVIEAIAKHILRNACKTGIPTGDDLLEPA